MSVDFKKELEKVARSTILVYEIDTLIKIIMRTIINKIKVTHASILLYDKDKDTYILTLSRGSLKTKVPVGLARIDKDEPLIYFFREHKNKLLFNNEVLVCEEASKSLKSGDPNNNLNRLLHQVLYQAKILETAVCIPTYFRGDLLGILLLGHKNNGVSFLQEELDFLAALASYLAMPIKNTQLFKELESELDRKHQLFIRTTIALAAAIEAKDHYTHGHTTRVTNLAIMIAKRLNQKSKKLFDEKFLENLHIASLLHDIGKIGVPEYILNKRGLLTVGEKKKIKEHPLIGATILKPIKELENSLLGIKYHHERYDGSGYPEGLKGEQIPLIASIISVADSFDAMTRDRPYRAAMYRNEAIEEIQRLKGIQFNPMVVEVFIKLSREEKI